MGSMKNQLLRPSMFTPQSSCVGLFTCHVSLVIVLQFNLPSRGNKGTVQTNESTLVLALYVYFEAHTEYSNYWCAFVSSSGGRAD